MAIFGNNWIDEPIDDDSPLFGHNLLDDTHYDYYKDENGDFQKITTKRELYQAIDNNNVYSFDGKQYNLK